MDGDGAKYVFGAFVAVIGVVFYKLITMEHLADKYDKVRADIRAILKNKDWDDGHLGPVLVRLAWHASGTFCPASKNGGSNFATMRFAPESTDGANNGLDHARNFLEPIKQKHPFISYADLWTLAGVVAVEEMSGNSLRVPWKPGRTDVRESEAASKVPPNGRLPDATQGAEHLRQVFGRMGFNDRDIVTLSGAHGLGRCHPDRSGFKGPWTHTPTKLTNQFYKLLLNVEWTKKEWDGPLQYKDPKDKLMMLPTDLVLIQDPKFKKVVKEYAESKELFYEDFARTFGRLLELGVVRK